MRDLPPEILVRIGAEVRRNDPPTDLVHQAGADGIVRAWVGKQWLTSFALTSKFVYESVKPLLGLGNEKLTLWERDLYGNVFTNALAALRREPELGLRVRTFQFGWADRIWIPWYTDLVGAHKKRRDAAAKILLACPNLETLLIGATEALLTPHLIDAGALANLTTLSIWNDPWYPAIKIRLVRHFLYKMPPTLEHLALAGIDPSPIGTLSYRPHFALKTLTLGETCRRFRAGEPLVPWLMTPLQGHPTPKLILDRTQSYSSSTSASGEWYDALFDTAQQVHTLELVNFSREHLSCVQQAGVFFVPYIDPQAEIDGDALERILGETIAFVRLWAPEDRGRPEPESNVPKLLRRPIHPAELGLEGLGVRQVFALLAQTCQIRLPLLFCTEHRKLEHLNIKETIVYQDADGPPATDAVARFSFDPFWLRVPSFDPVKVQFDMQLFGFPDHEAARLALPKYLALAFGSE